MQTAVDHLRASLDAALKAGGVPDGADIVFMPEPPVAMRAVALHGHEAWFGVQTDGAAPVVQKAASDAERLAAARAIEVSRRQPLPLPSYQDPKQTAAAHPGEVDESTPDDPKTGHGWKLMQSSTAKRKEPEKAPAPPPSASETLKAWTARIERMLPQVQPVHPLQKSFLLSEGFDAESVDRGEIEMTPHLRREYSRWLAKYTRDISAKLVQRPR